MLMAKRDKSLTTQEELDFQYLLGLMPPLHLVPEFSWLPELFAIIGHEKLITLCKYAGGEVIKIPTLKQLSDAIDALQWFYDVEIKHSKSIIDVPPELHSLYGKILEIYNVRNNKENN